MNRNQQAPQPFLEDPMKEQFSHAEFKTYFKERTQSMDTQNNHQIIASFNQALIMVATQI